MSEEGLPDFVEELRRISDKCLINDLPPSNEEIQKHLKNLKANKASNDVEPELLNKLNSNATNYTPYDHKLMGRLTKLMD